MPKFWTYSTMWHTSRKASLPMPFSLMTKAEPSHILECQLQARIRTFLYISPHLKRKLHLMASWVLCWSKFPCNKQSCCKVIVYCSNIFITFPNVVPMSFQPTNIVSVLFQCYLWNICCQTLKKPLLRLGHLLFIPGFVKAGPFTFLVSCCNNQV